VDEKRKEELFHIFDQTTEELLFLEVSAQELYARIQELEGREEM
jgi:4-hydroxyphenylpyruvate dioxygenase-like putative hemolysin